MFMDWFMLTSLIDMFQNAAIENVQQLKVWLCFKILVMNEQPELLE